MSDPPPSRENDSPLQAAMYMADVIRKHVGKKEELLPLPSSSPTQFEPTAQTNQSSSSTSHPISASLFDPPAITPGLMEGVVAGIVTFGLLTPIRRLLLQAAGQNLRVFADLVVTTSQAVVSANAALFVTALTGGRVYLQLFNNVAPKAPSTTADSICRDFKIQSYLQRLPSSPSTLSQGSARRASSIWDPRMQLGFELHQALETCRERNASYQQRLSQDDSTEEQQQSKTSWWN